jgi:hypothetical protein
MQLLPGRLEVVAGEPGYKEIRLVRVPGERPEVILGREVGEAPGYIALHSTTVSRRHARLAYANGTWTVANLSQTNPVVLNDQALAASHGERTLADGDCLELIAMSGWGHPGARDQAIQAGFDRHYLKPITLAHVAALLGMPPKPRYAAMTS